MSKLIAGLLLCALLTVCATGNEDKKPALYQQWRNGKVLVIIINADEDADSEQYADWSHYLNEFSSNNKDNFIFYKLAETDVVDLTSIQAEPYSILFFKKDKPSFLYQGAILEPQVYDYVKHIYIYSDHQPGTTTISNNKAIPKHLFQFAPDEIKIHWDSVKGKFIATP